jgi:hypothetical protein
VSVNGQGIASRHFDMAMWFLPLVIYPRLAKREPARHVAIAVTFVVFAAVRLEHIARFLSRSREELAGLHALAKDCPPAEHELAYVSMDMYSKHWYAPTFHHVAETLAASCRLDTPIYDPRQFPYNMAPVRYVGAPPAPPKFLHDDQTWYHHGGLFDAYEYVLVHAWKPTPEQVAQAEVLAERIRVAGEWELWRRKRQGKVSPAP